MAARVAPECTASQSGRRRPARRRSRRHGAAWTRALWAIAFLGAAGAGGYALYRNATSGATGEAPLTFTIKSGPYVHDVVQAGEIESSANVEVRCEVKSKSGQGASTTIIKIVDEGTFVNPGDFLVQLDDSSLLNDLAAQQSMVSQSEATVIQAEAATATAEIARREYLEGTFKQSEEQLQSQLFVAQENLRRAQEYLRYSQTLYARGYLTAVQLEADRFAVEKSQKELEVAETGLRVLRDYTQQKMLKQLDADIATAQAKEKAAREVLRLDKEKLELIQTQITKCKIVAPAAGQVVYANETNSRGGQTEVIIEPGASVREQQVLIRLPDPTKMQVKTKINEARVSKVRPGLPAEIRLQSLNGAQMSGTVTRVSDYPIPTSFFGPSVKEYQAYIQILNAPQGLLPGMTAEVAVRVEQLPDVVQAPVQAIVERGGKHYVLLYSGTMPPKAQEVEIGSTNDKFVVIRSGLKVNDTVLMNPRPYLEQSGIPEAAAEAPAMNPNLAAGEAPERKLPADGPSGGGGPGGAGGGRPGGAGGGRPNPAAMMEQMDQDKDGKIQVSEAPFLQRAFDAGADANGDGGLDASELQGAMSRMRPPGGGGGPPGGGPPGGGGA